MEKLYYTQKNLPIISFIKQGDGNKVIDSETGCAAVMNDACDAPSSKGDDHQPCT
jgi:hypothetical protein